jgi:hypothetical protein
VWPNADMSKKIGSKEKIYISTLNSNGASDFIGKLTRMSLKNKG